MSNPIEPNPVVIISTLNWVEAKLPELKAAIEAMNWHEAKRVLNSIHLDAKDARDYLYRCEGL